MKEPGAPKVSSSPPIAVLGVPFDNVSMAQTLSRIEEMVRSRQPHYVVTANVDFLVQARSDVELRRLLFDADMVLCDGMPVVWASRLLGNALCERVAGSDLVPELLRLSAEKKFRVYFLGATSESSRKAAEKCVALYPGLVVAGCYSPPFHHLLEMDHDEICRRVKEAQPDLLLVSFGCPKQEKWIGMHFRSVGVPVCIGVGATIDFLAGTVRRAPGWMQRSGTEWVFRLAQEPRRLFRRYARDLAIFGIAFATQWLGFRTRERRRSRAEAGADKRPAMEKSFRWPECLDRTAVSLGLVPSFAELAACRIMDVSGVRCVDSTGVSLLMRFQRWTRKRGGQMIWVGPSPAVERALRMMRVAGFFEFCRDMSEALERVEGEVGESSPAVRRLGDADARAAWSGEVTAENAAQIYADTQKIFATDPGASIWTVDLSGVSFLDSSGLGLLIRMKKRALASGTPIRFVGFQPVALSVIRLAKLESFLVSSDAEVAREERRAEPPASMAPAVRST